jgi:hypothetical protein
MDLALLREKVGPVFGCNALYRTFDPDYLIAFDDAIVHEISASTFDKNKLIVPPIEDQYEPAEAHLLSDSGFTFAEPGQMFQIICPRNNAGMVAMKEAIKRGYTTLFLIGMDFILDDAVKNLDNVYDGTNAYDGTTKASYQDTVNRCRFFNWFVLQYPDIKFVIVFPNGNYSVRITPTDQIQYRDYEGIVC